MQNFFRSIFLSVTVLVFASSVIAMLLGVRPSQLSWKKKFILFFGMALIIGVNIYLSLTLKNGLYGKYYTLLAQIPVLIVFLFVSDRGFIPVFFSTLTAIFLTFPLVISNTLIRIFIGFTPFWSLPISIVLCVIIIFLVSRFFKPNFQYMLDHGKEKGMLRFCIVPFLYNAIAYSIGKYNYTITIQIPTLPIRIMLFLMMLAAYFLLLDMFKSTRENEILQRDQELLSLQLKAARLNMEDLKSSQINAQFYRHDIRHHVSLISAFLEHGDLQQLRQYLNSVEHDIDSITPTVYCENETVNLILSSFATKAQKVGVSLSVEAFLPPALPVSDTELCAVLSNAIENAINATKAIANAEARSIKVQCRTADEKLLILIENPYVGEIIMENGLPQSQREGHGFGIKSMVSIVNRWGGLYSFAAENQIFTLRIVC